MLTKAGNGRIGQIAEGEEVLCYDDQTGSYAPFTVLQKKEYAGGVQKVYNIQAAGGTSFMMNDVMVLQK